MLVKLHGLRRRILSMDRSSISSGIEFTHFTHVEVSEPETPQVLLTPPTTPPPTYQQAILPVWYKYVC